MSGIASLRSPDGWFYYLGRKREFILKFSKIKITFPMDISVVGGP
jgi:hypothetical protein